MKLSTTTRNQLGHRAGITVIEVLSAMVVALIGVFGVMILIPFSVQQARNGLDRDEASTVGRNAFEQFEVEGFRYVDAYNRTRFIGSNGLVNLDGVPGVRVIDPIYVSENDNVYPDFCGFSRFNLVSTWLDVNDDLVVKPYSKAMARRLCRSTDDLQFESAVNELSPPQQIFDITAAGNTARRQTLGRISWNAVLVPVKSDYLSNAPTGGTPGLTFRMHVLTHKNRDLGLPTEVAYPLAEVIGPTNTVGYGGGTVTLNAALTDVRRDDWVMLRTAANSNTLDAGYNNQVGFYRVVGVDATGTILTLDGPDFNFGDANTTELHHLVGFRNGQRSGQVINVYERTTRWERKSNWN